MAKISPRHYLPSSRLAQASDFGSRSRAGVDDGIHEFAAGRDEIGRKGDSHPPETLPVFFRRLFRHADPPGPGCWDAEIADHRNIGLPARAWRRGMRPALDFLPGADGRLDDPAS